MAGMTFLNGSSRGCPQIPGTRLGGFTDFETAILTPARQVSLLLALPPDHDDVDHFETWRQDQSFQVGAELSDATEV